MAHVVNYLDKTEPFEVVDDACYSMDRWTRAVGRLAVVETGADVEPDENSLAAERRARSTPVSHAGMRLRTAPRASA